MSKVDWKLEGKSIIVTGASRGIGAAVAQTLGSCGACVTITYTGSSASSEEKANETAKKVEEAGGKALAIALDVSDSEQCNQVAKEAKAKFGGIHGLVNNAGIVLDGLAMRYKDEDFDRIMAVNIRGSFAMARAAMRELGRCGEGSIVNMSSVVALSGSAGQVPYSSTKGAIISMTKSLAKEMAPRSLRVNCIAPGYIQTDMTSGMDPEHKEELMKRIPLRREGDAEDIANGCLYLLSPLSSYVTGQVLNINGGLYM